MGSENLTDLQAKIDAINWYHEFDFPNGLKARTRSDVEIHRQIWDFIRQNLDRVDFRGKTVLDIGTWDGYWSFYAERQGAKSVLATDDVSQNWAEGTGIHLAKELLGSSIQINQNMSVYNLSSMNKKFDIILYLGVYYHLHDPFYAFSQIRHCCHENTLVLIDGPAGIALCQGGTLLDFKNQRCEFLPSIDGLQQLTDAAYFRNLKLDWHIPHPSPAEANSIEVEDRPGWRWRLRMCWDVLRGRRPRIKETLERIFPPPPPPSPPSPTDANRIFLQCVPFTGVNGIHCYKPPLGLHVYDDRFREEVRKVA